MHLEPGWVRNAPESSASERTQPEYSPSGIVNENSGELYIRFGSSHKTVDFIADILIIYWNDLDIQKQKSTVLI